MIRLTKLHSDFEDGKIFGKWIMKKKFNNGEWDCWFFADIYPDNMSGCEFSQYNAYISVSSPDAASQEDMERSICSYGLSAEEISSLTKIEKAEILNDYGIAAYLGSYTGTNYMKLLKEMRKEIEILISFSFGFRMDQVQNPLGHTGWDFVTGNLGFGRGPKPKL